MEESSTICKGDHGHGEGIWETIKNGNKEELEEKIERGTQ